MVLRGHRASGGRAARCESSLSARPEPARERKRASGLAAANPASVHRRDVARRPARKKSSVGRAGRGYMTAGKLVPDEIDLRDDLRAAATARLPPGLPVGRLSAHHRPGRGPRRDARAGGTPLGRGPGTPRCRKSELFSAQWPRPGRRSSPSDSPALGGLPAIRREPLLNYYCRPAGIVGNVSTV